MTVPGSRRRVGTGSSTIACSVPETRRRCIAMPSAVTAISPVKRPLAASTVDLLEVDPGRAAGRHQRGDEAGDLDVGVAGADARERAAQGGQHVLARQRPARAVEHAAVGGRGGLPDHGEAAGDGGELGRLDRDVAAWRRSGAEDARRFGAGVVAQRSDRCTTSPSSVVQRAQTGGGGRQTRGRREAQAGTASATNGVHGGSHRRLVRVESIWSLVVITRLFIS